MRDLLAQIRRWQEARQDVALATVVRVWGSAPRPLGSHMAVSKTGEMAGSVSGGCVEGAVVEEAGRVLASGKPKLLEFGVSDETAWSVGLSCGGKIEVFLEPLASETESELLAELYRHLDHDEAVARVLTVAGPGVGGQRLTRPSGAPLGSLGRADLDTAADRMATESFRTSASERRSVDLPDGRAELFCAVYPPSPKLILIGAVHVADYLARFARALGYRTILIDPRTAFATAERFSHVDELDHRWPAEALASRRIDESTAIATLSHDPKLDLPALEAALKSPARYIGALGSKRTHQARRQKLSDAGFAEGEIDRIHAPIGLDLGGRSAEEIALAVMAEIVAVSHGR